MRRYANSVEVQSDYTQLLSGDGGSNSSLLPGDLFVGGSLYSLDGSLHPLDYERAVIEMELPSAIDRGRIFFLWGAGHNKMEAVTGFFLMWCRT